MGSVQAEFLKLKRSMSWAVVIVLPLMAVITGTTNTVVSGQQLDDGWKTLWLRVIVFYGLFPLAVGVAALASLIWRVEHRDGNWNALMGRRVSSLEIVLGKAAVLAALMAAMQLVLLAGTVLAGKLIFGLPGFIPSEYLLVSVIIVLACLPVATLQSALSMLMRSFAAPIAIALLGAVVSVGLLLAEINGLIAVVPYALLGRATQLGTGYFADSGSITTGTMLLLIVASAGLTALTVVATAAGLDRRDIR
ncbi:ABC transporter permease [Pseudonocardia sp. KRD291]|uniref:ABC transporter permease n=1 Tax=Pseudonocardia sp. KRD291 TaxID=2792007 RepID=UPI001C4A00D7|nr:ABC transporter permease [Pseudonocardia sp. KRD291]MBW0103607.1 ABC transporter permease [Pseudonocardia sp. KRD291]